MKGLELSRLYYEAYCAPMLQKHYPALVERVAVGLVGEGSECFGFDDERSRDHDWGAALCLWLDEADFITYAEALNISMAELPDTIHGFPRRKEGPQAKGRSGVLGIWPFYYRYLGRTSLPEDPLDWLRIPEENLAIATNGKIFCDISGTFSAIRNSLLEHYPEEIRLKKLAASLAKMAQAGQYNLPRCLDRQEYVAASLAQNIFTTAACSVVYLINRRYRPFYKWVHRGLSQLPVLGAEIAADLNRLVLVSGSSSNLEESGEYMRLRENIIEEICANLALYIVEMGISDSSSDFLLDHALAVQERIQHPTLKRLDVFLG